MVTLFLLFSTTLTRWQTKYFTKTQTKNIFCDIPLTRWQTKYFMKTQTKNNNATQHNKFKELEARGSVATLALKNFFAIGMEMGREEDV